MVKHAKIQRIEIYDIVVLLLTIIVTAWYIMPKFTLTIPVMALAISLLVLSFLFCFNSRYVKTTELRFLGCLICLIVAIGFMYFLITYPFDTDKSIGIMTQSVINFFPIFIPLLLSRRSPTVRNVYIIVALVMIIIVFSSTLKEVASDPTILRQLAKGDEMLDSYRLKNVGGFSFSYGCCFICICLYSMLETNKYKLGIWQKIVLYTSVAFLVIFEIVTQYFSAVIVVLLGVAYLKIKSRKNALLFAIFLVPALLAFLYYAPSLFANSSSTNIKKIIEISNALFLHSSGASTVARMDVYKESFYLFTSSPILGNNLTNNDVGMHSSLLDTLARVGLVGFLFYFSILRLMVKKIGLVIGDVHSTSFSAIFIAYLFLICINPVFTAHEINYYVFGLIPTLLSFNFSRRE